MPFTYRLFLHLAVKRGELQSDRDAVLSLFFWGIVGVLLGGRLFSVLIYDPTGFYARNPLQIVFPFQRVDGALRFIGLQGMAYHGGLVGAAVAVVVYCRVKRLPVLHVVDLLAASAPLGYTFGRLGNFINGELYGRITSSPIGMVFPHAPEYPTSAPWVRELAEEAGLASAEGAALVNLPRYPSQLFEAFFEGVFLWALLWFVFRRGRPFPRLPGDDVPHRLWGGALRRRISARAGRGPGISPFLRTGRQPGAVQPVELHHRPALECGDGRMRHGDADDPRQPSITGAAPAGTAAFRQRGRARQRTARDCCGACTRSCAESARSRDRHGHEIGTVTRSARSRDRHGHEIGTVMRSARS